MGLIKKLQEATAPKKRTFIITFLFIEENKQFTAEAQAFGIVEALVNYFEAHEVAAQQVIEGKVDIIKVERI